MASEMPSEPRSSMLSKLKGWAGLPTGPGGSVPKPIKAHADPGLSRQDSFPEICSTPSDVGIFEVAHNKCRDADGKFSWRKFFFEAPGSSSPRAPAPSAGASAAAAAGGSSTQPFAPQPPLLPTPAAPGSDGWGWRGRYGALKARGRA
ncbi:hypothetical protein ABPG75_005488 [Micractinium tetrahymenae]